MTISYKHPHDDRTETRDERDPELEFYGWSPAGGEFTDEGTAADGARAEQVAAGGAVPPGEQPGEGGARPVDEHGDDGDKPRRGNRITRTR